jgi:hypothetical protein
LGERVAQVLRTDADRLIQGRYLDDVLEESPTIKDIDVLRFPCNLVGAAPEVVISTAKQLLACYGEILRAAKETV